MKPTTLFAPAMLVAGLSSAPALAHGGATVMVGLPPVAVDVGGVQVVIGPVLEPTPPPAVVVVHEPAPPPRVVYVHEVPASSVMVYPRHRYPEVVTTREVVVVDTGGCDHPGNHYGHHKQHGKHHGKHHDASRGQRAGDRGVWR